MYAIVTNRAWNHAMADRLARRLGQPFHLITSRVDLDLEALKRLRPKKLFFPHWSHIVPEEIFNAFECVMFHMTDLPFGRGGSPLQNLIVRGLRETKISALRCEEDIDAGPVYLKKGLSLEGTAQEIFERARPIIEEMIEEIITGDLQPEPQEGEVTTFKRRKPEESDIGRLESIDRIYDYIRMLDAEGYPRAFLDLGEKIRLEFRGAELEKGRLRAEVRFFEKE